MKPILVFHYDEAPEFLKSMRPADLDLEFIILVPTGISETEQIERRLNIVKAQRLLSMFGVNPARPNVTGFVGQTTHSDGIHYRVFIV